MVAVRLDDGNGLGWVRLGQEFEVMDPKHH